MADKFELAVSARTDIGKGASRRLRHAGSLPGVVYGGEGEATAVTLSHHVLYHAYERGNLMGLFSLSVDGNAESVIVRDIQHHHYKPFIQHIDFLRVNRKEIIKVQVALNFIGEELAPGIKTDGGVLMRSMTDLEIECPAGKIPEAIDVDVSALSTGDSIHLSEVIMPEDATLPALFEFANMSEEEQNAINALVVSITTPTVEAEPTEDAESAGDSDGAENTDAQDD